MRDPYQVLGISPGAPDDEVKRAFRQLAKQLHPDLHPNDADAGLRFREVVSAYQALSNAPPHAGLDAASHAPRRRARWATAATAAVVFLMTVSSVAVVVLLWTPGEAPMPARQGRPPSAASGGAPISVEPPPAVSGSVSTLESQSAKAGAKIVAPARSSEAAAPRERPSSGEPVAHSAPPKNGAAMGETLATGDAIHVDAAKDKERLSGSSERRAVPPARDQVASNAAGAAASVVPPDPTKALTWISFRSARFGFSLAYPSEVFLADAAPSDEGASFRSRDGRARLTISVGMNTDRTTLAAQRRSLMNGPYGGAVFDYAPRRAYWFVLSGILGSEIFYQRVTFSCDRRTVHSWKLVYPLSERALYDRIVEGVHRRYHHGNGPGARCEGASQEAARKGEG